MLTIWWGWVILIAMMIAAICFICGALVMRTMYQKILKSKEERLTSVLARMDTLGGYIKSEILHVEESEEAKAAEK